MFIPIELGPRLLDKTFDSVDEAMAFYYDNELDAEFSKSHNRSHQYITFACARNKNSSTIESI